MSTISSEAPVGVSSPIFLPSPALLRSLLLARCHTWRVVRCAASGPISPIFPQLSILPQPPKPGNRPGTKISLRSSIFGSLSTPKYCHPPLPPPVAATAVCKVASLPPSPSDSVRHQLLLQSVEVKACFVQVSNGLITLKCTPSIDSIDSGRARQGCRVLEAAVKGDGE